MKTKDETKSDGVQTDRLGDLASLRITQNFGDGIGVKKALLHVPVRKPQKQEFFRVHPDENMRINVAMIDLKEEREVFLVAPELAQELPGDISPKMLVTAINRQGVLFLWPVNLDLEDSRIRRNHWNESARTAAELATKNWIKMVANMGLGSYEVFQASSDLGEPEWPQLSFQEILGIAFKNNFITSADHIVIRKLLGAI